MIASAVIWIGLIVKIADALPPAADAVIVTFVDALIPTVLTVNVADDAPAATVTVDGTDADTSSVVKLMMAPPDGAGWLRVTVPVEADPPMTVVGLSVKPLGDGMLNILLMIPLKLGQPHPEAVSQPGTASDELLFSNVPLLPDTTSKKTVGSPLKE